MDRLALNKEQSASLSILAKHAMSMYKMPSDVRMKLIEIVDTVDERNFVALQICFANLMMQRMHLTEKVVMQMIKTGKTHDLFMQFMSFVSDDYKKQTLENLKERLTNSLKEEKQA